MRGLPSILSPFANSFDKFSITVARIFDSLPMHLPENNSDVAMPMSLIRNNSNGYAAMSLLICIPIETIIRITCLCLYMHRKKNSLVWK